MKIVILEADSLLEPARKRAGFFIGKIAAKTYNKGLLKNEQKRKSMPCKTDF